MHIDKWRSDFIKKSNARSEDYPFIIVGNKYDLDDERVVSKDKIDAYCKNNGGLKYVETSAKDNY